MAPDCLGLAKNVLDWGLIVGLLTFLKAQAKKFVKLNFRPGGGPLGFVGFNWQGIGSGYRRIGYFVKDWLKIGTNWVVCQSLSIHWYWLWIGNFGQSVSNSDQIGLDDRHRVQK